VRDDPTVACGVWPFVLSKTRFLDACEWHDQTYLKGSWAQANLTRAEVDRRFLEYMKLRTKGSTFHTTRAYLLYGIARAFGGLFWEGKK